MSPRCGRCGAELSGGDPACPDCGRPAELVSTPGGVPQWGGLDIGGPPRAGPASQVGSSAAGSSQAAVPDARLEGSSGPADAACAGDSRLDDPFSAFDGGAAMELAVAPARPAAAPVGRRPPAEPDEAQVRAAAGFGPPPQGVRSSIAYALQVLQRRPELREQLARARAELAQRAAQTDASLGALGERMYARKQDPALRPFDKLLAAVEDAREGWRERTSVQRDAGKEAQARLETLASDAARVRRGSLSLKVREGELQTQLDGARRALKRAQAMVRRVDIEVRAEQAAGVTADPARQAQRVALRRQHEDQVRAAEQQVRALDDELGQLHRELARELGTAQALDEQRQRVSRQLAEVEGSEHEAAQQAQHAMKRALRSLARAALQSDDPPVDEALVQAARHAIAAEREAERRHALYERALGAYDVAGFKRGLAGLAAGAVLAMLPIVALILR